MGLDIKKRYKLKHLFSIWPIHTVATASWLADYGITYSNLNQYVKTGWIRRIGAGAFVRVKDTVCWKGAIFGLQKQYPQTFHVGGFSALELSGDGHFIPMGPTKNFLFSVKRRKLPLWFEGYFNERREDLTYLQYSFLPPQSGMTIYDCGEFKIDISTRERASLEAAELVGRFHDFAFCRLLFENLGTLRPLLVQQLLTDCTSVKAKRLFLFLSKNMGHQWYRKLDLTRVNLGKGPRDLCSGGAYDKEFHITYPRDLFHDNKRSL